jgi:serine phosphatase RsbU (regulator of sigma subunit)
MSGVRRWEVTVDGSETSLPKRVCIEREATVGRDSENEICILNPLLSRRHARFVQRDGSLYVSDMDSANGTYVNDVRIHAEQVLHEGDVVTVGGTLLMFHETDYLDELLRTGIRADPTRRTIHKSVDVANLVDEDRSLGVISRATNALVEHRPLPEILDKVLEAVLDSIPAQRAAIILIEGQPAVLTLKAERLCEDLDVGEMRHDIIRQALEKRLAILVHDAGRNPASQEASVAHVSPIVSVMCAPLWAPFRKGGGGRVSGLIYLDSSAHRPPLTDRDLHILVMLANIAATKVENTRLVEETLQRYRIEEDMRLAAKIQTDLLPLSSPTVPGYNVCGTTKPCRMVGGDYFDFDFDGRKLHLVLADVSGKGTGAAMLMVALRATVRAHWQSGPLTEATTRINRTFHQNVPSDKYATLFIARLDPESGRLEYVNAGHNRPVVVQPNGRWEKLEVGGTVVGAFCDGTYQQDAVVLEPGSCLLVFSDGITDAWPDEDTADRQLANMTNVRKRGDLDALRAAIFKATEAADDDRTLIIIERLPADVAASEE